jgi:hypothetical protein
MFEIILIAFLAVLCGALHHAEMAEFGCAKLKFLKRFLKLKHSIPSHDTFSTHLRILDPKALDVAFGRLFGTLVAALAKGGVIDIDRKSLKSVYVRCKESPPEPARCLTKEGSCTLIESCLRDSPSLVGRDQQQAPLSSRRRSLPNIMTFPASQPSAASRR